MSFIARSLIVGRHGIREVAKSFHLTQKVDREGGREEGGEQEEIKIQIHGPTGSFSFRPSQYPCAVCCQCLNSFVPCVSVYLFSSHA